VEEMLSFVPQRSLASAWRESDNSARSAKALSSLHADGQLGGEYAQVIADLVLQKPAEIEVA